MTTVSCQNVCCAPNHKMYAISWYSFSLPVGSELQGSPIPSAREIGLTCPRPSPTKVKSRQPPNIKKIPSFSSKMPLVRACLYITSFNSVFRPTAITSICMLRGILEMVCDLFVQLPSISRQRTAGVPIFKYNRGRTHGSRANSPRAVECSPGRYRFFIP